MEPLGPLSHQPRQTCTYQAPRGLGDGRRSVEAPRLDRPLPARMKWLTVTNILLVLAGLCARE